MKDLMDLLDIEYQGRKVPVARNEFDEPQEPPFIVYISESPDLFGAENIVYYKSNRFRVELYTNKKEGTLEEMLEDLFTANELYYEKDGDVKVSSENLWLTTFYV
jgi:hypothetical protein